MEIEKGCWYFDIKTSEKLYVRNIKNGDAYISKTRFGEEFRLPIAWIQNHYDFLRKIPKSFEPGKEYAAPHEIVGTDGSYLLSVDKVLSSHRAEIEGIRLKPSQCVEV